jgi:hypothetical protein
MSGAHPEFEWHLEARDELQAQGDRLLRLLEELSEDVAVNAPFAPGLEYIVQPEHVLSAAKNFAVPSDKLNPVPEGAPFAFVSYSTRDVEFVRELSADIEQAGIRCFRDERSIRTGAQWIEELHDALRQCRVFVMVVTPQTLSSDWCKIEAGAAWGLNKPILAVLRHVAPSQLPGPLASLQARVVETRQQQAEFVHDLHKYFASDDEGSSDD